MHLSYMLMLRASVWTGEQPRTGTRCGGTPSLPLASTLS